MAPTDLLRSFFAMWRLLPIWLLPIFRSALERLENRVKFPDGWGAEFVLVQRRKNSNRGSLLDPHGATFSRSLKIRKELSAAWATALRVIGTRASVDGAPNLS